MKNLLLSLLDNRRKRKAMTLIELLIAIAILSLVMYPIYEFLQQGAQAWEVGENRTEVIQNARIGIKKVANELHGALAIYDISISSIRFWARDENNNDSAEPNEIVAFSWSLGNDLTRKTDAQSQTYPVAGYVDNFTLNYWDPSGVSTNDPDEVKVINITLETKKTVRGHDYTTKLRTSVGLRNL